MQLHEQYRPTKWSDVVGQDKIVARIQALAKRGLAGRAFWLSGPVGDRQDHDRPADRRRSGR